MSRHAVRATVAVAALSLAVLGSPVQAQDTPSAAQELADLRARAEAGDASAQYNLGLMHAEGRGVPQDFAEAATWYRKAAEQGEALLHESSMARTRPIDRILTCRCDTTLVGRGRSSD